MTTHERRATAASLILILALASEVSAQNYGATDDPYGHISNTVYERYPVRKPQAAMRRVADPSLTLQLAPQGPSPGEPPGSFLPPPPPVPSAPASSVSPANRPIHERAGSISQQSQTAAEELEKALKQLKDDIANHEAFPNIDAVRETERINTLKRYVSRMVAIGDKTLKDEAAFSRTFRTWIRVSGSAAGTFREAEDYFHKKALEAEFPETKSRYEQYAKWYAARATRHEARSKTVIPTTVAVERRRIAEMVQSLKELLAWLDKDPYALGEDDREMQANLRDFMKAYVNLGDVLNAWTDKLLEGLSDGDGANPPKKPLATKPAAEPATRQASRTFRPASTTAPANLPSKNAQPKESFLESVTKGQR